MHTEAFPGDGPGALALASEFQAAGMVYLANRVLHPFGWALGVVVTDDDPASEAPLHVVALTLNRTADREGIVYGGDSELRGRERLRRGLTRWLL